MFSKATFVVALFAVSKLALATPPACLLAAVNEQPDPSDFEAICGSEAKEVLSFLGDNCGDSTDLAVEAFKETCSDQGYTVSGGASSTKTSSGSHATGAGSGGYVTIPISTGYTAPTGVLYTSTYFDSDCSCTKTAAIAYTGTGVASTGLATVTGGASNGTYGSATASPTVSASATQSAFEGTAGRVGVGSFAAIGLAALGMVAAL